MIHLLKFFIFFDAFEMKKFPSMCDMEFDQKMMYLKNKNKRNYHFINMINKKIIFEIKIKI
jgi:hypothetical protein